MVPGATGPKLTKMTGISCLSSPETAKKCLRKIKQQRYNDAQAKTQRKKKIGRLGDAGCRGRSVETAIEY